MRSLLVAVAMFSMCAKYYPERHANITQYEISTSVTTPKGIRVDRGQHDVDLAKIDRHVDDLESCLGMRIRRNAFVVKFPSDLYLSPCTGEEIFPCKMPVDVCIRKISAGSVNLLPGSPCSLDDLPCTQCPCHCRAAIQGNAAIVTNTRMNLFRAELARLVTGEIDPWSSARLSRCIQ